MSRPIFQLRMFRARNWYECAFCRSPIQKGDCYYRDDPHPMARYHRGQTARQICVHCINSDVYFEEQRRTGQFELPFDEQRHAALFPDLPLPSLSLQPRLVASGGRAFGAVSYER